MSSDAKWTLYDGNGDAWRAMLADCAAAERSISLEQFIFRNDDFGGKLIEICAERAAAGVDVRFLWDAAGSWSLRGSSMAGELRRKGIKLVFWKTLIPEYSKFPRLRSWFFRNHRRTLVIDGRIGYTGSMCVADHTKDWRDANCRLEGRIARQMENAFDRMWDRAVHSRPLPRKLHYESGGFRYETNYPAPGRRRVYAAVRKAVRLAEKRIWLSVPYFVPTHKLVRLLRSAAEYGVDTRIILPEKSDHAVTDMAARTLFDSLLSSGVRIYLYRGNMIHGKTMVIDDHWATVGSMNWDRLSLLYNFEANIISTDPDFAVKVAERFRADMDACREIILGDWRRRSFLEHWKELPAYLLRKFL